MSIRDINLLLLLFIISTGTYYFITSIGMIRDDSLEIFLNPGFFPIILSSLLLVLCIISVVQTVMRNEKNEKFDFNNTRILAIIIILTITYVFLWQAFSSLFYVFTFLFIFISSIILSSKKKDKKKYFWVNNLLVALSLLLVIYLIFDLTFSVRFT